MSRNDPGPTSASRDQIPTDTPDDALILAVADGDEQALRLLYERHAPWLAVRIRRSLPASAVEDVLQETFVAVWRGATRFRQSGETGAWLWGIARRQAAMWQRRHGRAETSFDELLVGHRLASPDPGHEAITRIELQQVLAAAGNPGSAGHDLAQRVFIEQQPFAEIAADLDVPTGTIKSRVFKLRQTMKQALGKEAGS